MARTPSRPRNQIDGDSSQLKVNRATRKPGVQSSGTVKRHSAQPPAITEINQPGKLNLLEDLGSFDSERASLETLLPFLHERVAFKIPSDIKYLDSVLDYINDRMLKLGLVDSEESTVLIALDE